MPFLLAVRDAIFLHFRQTSLMTGDLNVQNQLFKMSVPCNGLYSTNDIITTDFLKRFVRPRGCIFKVKTKLDANSIT